MPETPIRSRWLPPHHVRRPRLTQVLDATRAAAVVVHAPAGYGKSSLAVEWLGGRRRVAWYRATRERADVAAVSLELAAALAPVVPAPGQRLRGRLRALEESERLARPLAELLAEDLVVWPEDGWLVVDDYHLLAESAPVEEFFEALLSLSPLRLLVTTRTRPAWATARRLLYGEVFELGVDELAMTEEEAAAVIGRRPARAVEALVRRAHGWPALIGLAGLAATTELPPARTSSALYRYFAEEVLLQQPPELQQLMLVAAVPQVVAPEAAVEVLGVADAAAGLRRLADAAIVREERGRLRFHPLLRDFLRARLAAEQPELAAAVAARAIARARREGSWEEAFELASSPRAASRPSSAGSPSVGSMRSGCRRSGSRTPRRSSTATARATRSPSPSRSRAASRTATRYARAPAGSRARRRASRGTTSARSSGTAAHGRPRATTASAPAPCSG
jgi:ATP/maltotriose-dependent transcriptional regulator MalT